MTQLKREEMEKNNNKGRLFLIPSPLGENDPREVIPDGVLSMLPKLTTYVVEATGLRNDINFSILSDIPLAILYLICQDAP